MRLRFAATAIAGVLFASGCGGSTEAESSPTHKVPARTANPPRYAPSVAVGDLSGLRPAVQRAFSAHVEDFEPLSTPGPDDWLASQEEEPQSVGNYVVSEPNLPGHDGRDTIYILPLGAVPELSALRAFAADFFTLPVVVLPAADLSGETLTRRTNGAHRQVLATDLQAYLQAHLPADAYAMIGLTAEDLYPSPDYNYVFGLASIRKRTGVFSFARYDPRFYDPSLPANPTLTRERAYKILAHEIGHMFGMGHCLHHACLMNGSNHAEELDRAPLALCPVCLRKLHLATDFDPVARYETLAGRYRDADLAAPAAFVRKRLERIRDRP